MKNANVRHLEVGVKRKLARYGRNDTYAGLWRFFETFNKVLKYSASMLYRDKPCFEVFWRDRVQSVSGWNRKWANDLYLRWPDTIHLREGKLFWNQILRCSTTLDCWDILDAEKEMLEVYQKSTSVAMDTNIRKFSAIFLSVVFKENAYYWENENKFFLHIILNRCWNL